MQPNQRAAALRRRVQQGELTDCEALTAFATQTAESLNFQGSNISSYFVQDFGTLVQGNHLVVQAANALGISVSNTPTPIYFWSGGESGFAPQYRDNSPQFQDQGHHFAAFFQFGYQAGAAWGNVAATLLDLLNPGDRELGRRAAQIGADLRAGRISMWGVAFELSQLCNR